MGCHSAGTATALEIYTTLFLTCYSLYTLLDVCNNDRVSEPAFLVLAASQSQKSTWHRVDLCCDRGHFSANVLLLGGLMIAHEHGRCRL